MHKLKKIKVGKKRGLSPVVATVLLIVIVFVLAALIFMYLRGFIFEQIQKFGKPAQQVCPDVVFDANLMRDLGSSSSIVVEFVNKGNVMIHHFQIKQTYGGDSQVRELDFSLDKGEAARSEIALVSGAEEINFYPLIVGQVVGQDEKRKLVLCSDNGKTINL